MEFNSTEIYYDNTYGCILTETDQHLLLDITTFCHIAYPIREEHLSSVKNK